MLSLDVDRLAAMSIPVGASWLLASCMEARGKPELWLKQRPQVLEGRVWVAGRGRGATWELLE